MRTSRPTLITTAVVPLLAGVGIGIAGARYADHVATQQMNAREADATEAALSERDIAAVVGELRLSDPVEAYIDQCMRERIAESDEAANHAAERGVVVQRKYCADDMDICRRQFHSERLDRELRERYGTTEGEASRCRNICL